MGSIGDLYSDFLSADHPYNRTFHKFKLDEIKRLAASFPARAFVVHENAMLRESDIIVNEETWHITVGSIYRFFIMIWGIDKGVEHCCQWALNGIYSNIDKKVKGYL